MPTKIEVCEPLITFFSTSRPHLSPPKGKVAARVATASARPAPFALMSAITSASGSTLLVSGAGGDASPGLVAPALIAASASASGSAICRSDSFSAVPGSPATGAPGTAPAGAVAASGPTNVGGA
jgi:hypothetical protein